MWINVKDRLPDKTIRIGESSTYVSDDLLIVSDGVVYGEVRYSDAEGFYCNVDMSSYGDYNKVTHWMHYPKPPTI